MISLFFLGVGCAQEQTVSVATGEWPPFSSSKMVENGMCSELVKAAFKAVDVDVKYFFYPWKRAWLSVEKGKVSASFPWLKNEFRQDHVFFSDSLYDGQRALFFNKKKLLISSETNSTTLLSKYKLYLTAGDAYIKKFDKKGKTYRIVPSLDSAIKMLARGHIDLLFINYHVGWYELDKLFHDRIREFGSIMMTDAVLDNYIIFPKVLNGAEQLRDQFNKGLSLIKDNGTYGIILKKYDYSYD